jgi:SsrA-binding protein
MKSKKSKSINHNVVNRRASFDYALESDLTVGISLTGPEVRAARNGHVGLKGAFVSVRDDELWLNNASFTVRKTTEDTENIVDTSPRRLLAHRRQIDELIKQKQSGMSIVPTKLLSGGRFIKVVIAVGKGKKNYDKRETIKRRDQERDIRRAIKNA